MRRELGHSSLPNTCGAARDHNDFVRQGGKEIFVHLQVCHVEVREQAGEGTVLHGHFKHSI